MCGISGIVDYNNMTVSKDVMHKMCLALSHRGPDDEGVYINSSSSPSVGLGHRRLSIIDLSQSGHQPMSNEDGSVVIVFNGEVYNYPELRTELEAKGHKFKSNTDTETALHLYEELGEDFVKRLRGMFAFAIWDDSRKTLILGRDRTGKKPLLYFHDKGRFVFASEFASIFESGIIEKDVNNAAIDRYLTFGYVPAPFTAYSNVFKLLPAHILVLKDDKVMTRRYWQLDYSKKIDISEEDAASEVLRLLRHAVRIRMHSDVPLGAFLSGGIDSSAVVALMSQGSEQRIKTFSIGFEAKDYDELKYARNVADRFNTDHHEFVVRPDAASILPLLVERYGEPYADSSCIPTYYVANETKKYVTVALNGDGGDEVFGGYERYQAMVAAQILQGIPRFLSSAVKGAAAIIPDSVNSKNTMRRMKRFAKGMELPVALRYLRWISIFNDRSKSELYSEWFKKELCGDSPLEARAIEIYLENEKNDLVDRLLNADVNTYLPDDLLVKVDITSMANSLEARSPFLDQELMEFAASLPAGYKVDLFSKKRVLKKAIRGIVPSENIDRKKMGFGVPVGDWLRKDLRDMFQESVLSPRSASGAYFSKGAIKRMFDAHADRREDHTLQLWALLMFELWHEKFIRKDLA